MKKQLVIIGIIILLFSLSIECAKAGYTCSWCGGDGKYTIGGVESTCIWCGGDGCLCSGDRGYKDYLDTGSCSCEDYSSPSPSGESFDIVYYIVGAVLIIFMLILIIFLIAIVKVGNDMRKQRKK